MSEKTKLFHFAIDNGILNLHNTNELMQMKKREETLQEHSYSIWQGNDGRWRTYIVVNGKRKLIVKSTKENLENEIIKYKEQEKYNPTVTDMYNQWIDSKLSREEITATTKNRYDRQYAQSMEQFGNKHVKDIEAYDIEQFILDAIHDNKLTPKGYSNLRTLLYGIFKLAKKQKLITWSITETIHDIDISKNAFRKIIHSDEELVFQIDEVPKIMEAIDNMGYDTINLALLLMFNTGCRPGEIVALTPQDLLSKSIIVCKTEVQLQDKHGITYEIADRAKTEAGIREIPIPDKSIWILNRILFMSKTQEFVFEQNGKRVNSSQLRQRLRTLCKRSGIVQKSPNKIRKTYASILLDNGVDKSIVTKVMGHTDIKTTEDYYYKNRHNSNQIAEQINTVNW